MSDGHERFRQTKHFVGLDGIRAAAILSVVWHHSDPPTPEWLPGAANGFLGVDLFFVLSGFLIVTLLLRERDKRGAIDIKAFWARRVLRIFPLYYGVVLGLAVLAVVKPGGATVGYLDHLPYLLTYTANWVPYEGIMAVAWSLCAEEQFYAVWPPIERFLPKRASLVLAIALVVNVAIMFGALDGLGADRIAICDATFAPILLGVAIAHGLHDRAMFARLERVLGHRLAPLVTALCILGLANVPGDLSGWPRFSIHLAMTAFVTSVAMSPQNVLTPLLELSPVRRIGVVSYGMYLLHMFAHHVVAAITSRVGSPPGLTFALMVPATWGVAELSFRFYETPFLKLKTRFARGES